MQNIKQQTFQKFISFIVISCSVAVLFMLYATSADAATTSSIAILSPEEQQITYFDSEGNEIASEETGKKYFKKTSPFIAAKLRNKKGSEWVTYIERAGKKKTRVQNSLLIGNQKLKSTQFEEVYSGKKKLEAAIAVGEVSSDFKGKEVVVCQKKKKEAQLKVYSYASEGGFVEILALEPFETEEGINPGCSAVAIGDYDGDEENEIIAVQYKSVAASVFDFAGEVEDQFELPEVFSSGKYNAKGFYATDTDGDDEEDEMIFTKKNKVYIFTPGEKNYSYYGLGSVMKKKQLQSMAYGDVDDDGKNEIVILKNNPVGTVYVLTTSGLIEEEFDTFPDSTTKMLRKLQVGQFSH